MLIAAGRADAATVQVLFTGRFAQGHGVLFNASDSFNGSFTFDTSAPALDHPDATLNFQYVAVNPPTLPDTGWSLTVNSSTALGTYVISGNHGVLALGNDTAFGDRYAATLLNATPLALPAGNALNFFQIDLTDPVSSGADMLQGDTLTSLPNLALAQGGSGRFFVAANSGGCQQCQLEITSFTPVPLPAAGWLLISGIAGLAGLRRLGRNVTA